MDTRALGGEFLPRGEILTVEMKTVTQYSALIRLTDQIQEQEHIPDRSERKERKDSSRSFSDIDHMYGICVNGGSKELLTCIFSRELFEKMRFVKVLLVFTTPSPSNLLIIP